MIKKLIILLWLCWVLFVLLYHANKVDRSVIINASGLIKEFGCVDSRFDDVIGLTVNHGDLSSSEIIIDLRHLKCSDLNHENFINNTIKYQMLSGRVVSAEVKGNILLIIEDGIDRLESYDNVWKTISFTFLFIITLIFNVITRSKKANID